MGVRGTRAWVAGAVIAAALALPVRALAGEWHGGATLRCSDCHTMHNSRGGLPMRYDASHGLADQLLRAENATALCLACHSGGAGATAPSVRTPSNWDPPGGGFPAELPDPAHVAHSLDTEPLQPPDGDTPVVMTCITCHDPHGNGVYRNLRPNPSGDPTRTPVTPVAQQAVVANGTNAAAVYVRSNVRYVSGMSEWCRTCHNNLDHMTDETAHPSDLPIWNAAAASYADWSETYENRVPVQNALAQPAPHEADRVFCLSCHKAHGSPNQGAVIHANGDQTSTCAQCHSEF